jgi:hypothetical protein
MHDIEPIIVWSFGIAVIMGGGVCGRLIFKFSLKNLRVQVKSEIAESVEQEVLARFKCNRIQHMETEGTIFKRRFLIIKDTLYYDNFPTALCGEERRRVDKSVDTESLQKIADAITTTVQQVADAICKIKALPHLGDLAFSGRRRSALPTNRLRAPVL